MITNDVAQIILDDGNVLYGRCCGAKGSVFAEIVFVTAMTGYEKILTDPSYKGQIVLFTTPHVGVVGMSPKEFESDAIGPSGCIFSSVSHTCFYPDSLQSLPLFLKARGVVAIDGVDTRALAKKIRSGHVTRASIITGAKTGLIANQLQRTKLQDTITAPLFRVAVIDFGVKESILQELSSRGASLLRIDPFSSIDVILKEKCHGVVISNGPADPRDYDLALIKALLDRKVPILGICLGHQLIASALGARLSRLSLGHRSSNHPVIELATNKVFITAQNHGYHVLEEALPSCLAVSYRSLVDGSIEGFVSNDYPLITVQYHPEGGPGPSDLTSVFDDFFSLMRGSHAKTF